MRNIISIPIVTLLCMACLILPFQVFAHEGGGGGGGGGGGDGNALGGRSGGFGSHGPSIEPIRGIEGFPTIPGDSMGWGNIPRGHVPINDGPEGHSPTQQTAHKKQETITAQLINMIVDDLWQDKTASIVLAPVPPILAAYKSIDTLSKVFTLSILAAKAIDQQAKAFRAPYTKAAAGFINSGMTFSHPEGHSHPEGGYGLNPNTPTSCGNTGGGGPAADMIQDYFWH